MPPAPDGRLRVTVIGDVLVDELVYEDGALRVAGGSGLNVAIGLRVLGVPVSLIAMVGDDAEGDFLRSHLDRYGVEFLPTLTPLGTGVAQSERVDGEPRYVFTAPMRDRRIGFDAAQRRAIRSAGAVAISGFPLDNEEQRELLADALKDSAGVVAIDPNPRAGMLRDAAEFARGLERLGDTASLLKLGADDAQLLYQGALPAALQELRARYRHVVATEGASGATVYVGDRSAHVPSRAAPGAVVDAMGAGDAVFATMLAEIAAAGLEHVDWSLALKRAMRVAAATLAHPGALLRLPAGDE